MKRFICQLSVILIFLLVFNSCTKTKKDDFPLLKGPYFGQEPPGVEPQMFLPGLISTNYVDQCIAFLDGGRVCVFSIWEKGTYYMYEKDGRWTPPQKAPWQNEPVGTDYTAGPDDRTIYFQSHRPTSADDEKQENNTWTVAWTGESWTEPEPLPVPANSKEYSEGYPSVAPDGTVYFFTRSRPDSRDGDIYRTRFSEDGGGYLEAERLEEPINSEYYEVDPFIAPDGSYLLFGSDRPGGYSLFDLYICFREADGKWTHPFNTGPTLNPLCDPVRMSVTPDGKYLFFPSRQNTTIPKGEEAESAKVELWGDSDVYWISTDFIHDLREQYMGKKCAADEIRKEYLNSGMSDANVLLGELYSRKKNAYYFELSEFLVFCGEMIAKNDYEQADKFYATLLAVFPGEYRIMLGYSVACIINGRTARGLELMKGFWSLYPDLKSDEMFMITYQLRNKSRKEDELEVLRFGTDEFPGSAKAFYFLAEAYRHYGDTELAIATCRKALELKPDFDEAAVLLKKLELNDTHE